MSNFAKQQEMRNEAKEREKNRRDNLGKYFYDLSKLSFAGIVVGIVVPLFSDAKNATMWIAALFGIILTISSAVLANKILK